MTADVHDHLLQDQPRSPVPYRCTRCDRIGVTDKRRPKCCGLRSRPYQPASMARVPARRAGEAEDLVIR